MAEYGNESAAPEEDGAPKAASQNSAAQLMAFMQSGNIAEELDDDQLADIASKVVTEYEADKDSCFEWYEKAKKGLDLAKLVAETKSEPFENASNVKYPLLTSAALQFNARAYPAIVQGDSVVKCKVRGRDPDGTKAARSDRVSEWMSDDLLHQMPEWEADTDKLLTVLPIGGCYIRKVFYDPALGRKVSRLIAPDKFVVNYNARSIQDTPRMTEEMDFYPYEIEERVRDGRFLECDYGQAEGGENDTQAPHRFLEQHRLLDLDEDGYPEPYVVTVHKEKQKVVRITACYDENTARFTLDGKVAAIRRLDYYAKYDFLPSMDGGFYGWGFGHLLHDINESINTSLNQMFDAGTLSNMQGGIVSAEVGFREKSLKFKRGEWKVLQTNMPLQQAVLPIKYDGPSPVLFNLLGLLVEAGKEVASIKDVLTGDTPSTAPVGTTLALIEQGLQVFTSIYKRVHRCLKHELEIHRRLNKTWLTPEKYGQFFDEPADPQADFDDADMDVLPVSDPQAVTKMQRIAKAQVLLEIGRNDPLFNQQEIRMRFLEAIEAEEPDKLLAPPPQPDPIVLMMAELEAKERAAGIKEKLAKALKAVADAEAVEAGTQLQQYDLFLRTLQVELGAENGQGGVPGMEGQPGNPMGAGAPPPGQAPAGAGPQGLPPPPVGGGNGAGMGQPAGPVGLPSGAM